MDRAYLISRLASLGLATVIVALMGLATWAATTTQRVAEHARTATALSDLYQTAGRWITVEQSLERRYRLEPTPAVYERHRAAAQAMVSALWDIRAGGDNEDRRVIDAALQENALYTDATSLMFAGVDANDTALVNAIDIKQVRPSYLAIERSVARRGAEQHRRASEAFRELADTQNTVVSRTLAISAFGIVMVAVFWSILRTYRRRIDDAYRLELTRLERESLTDSLTKLGNHRAYQEDIAREIARAIREGQAITLTVMDVDEFKVVNDQYGHSHGDTVLIAVGELLRSGRLCDRIYRIGGDEFALILPNTSAHDASAVVARLRAQALERELPVTLSMGVADLPAGCTDVSILQDHADAALYEAKRRGRDAVVSFADMGHGITSPSAAKVKAIRAVLLDRRVSIVFQPIWQFDPPQLLGFEALTRLSPQYGFSGPEEAFDAAQMIGRAHELDTICRNAILERGSEVPEGALLFINVSPLTLDHHVLGGTTLTDVVQNAGLSPQRVVLEITERSAALTEDVIAEAKRLRALGFALALDDVGAGNAGLEMLSKLPVDYVKIDRSIVVNARHDRSTRSVLAGIVAIARANTSSIIAEGIEDAQTLGFLREFDRNGDVAGPIRGFQGYFLGRPAPAMVTGTDALPGLRASLP